MPAPSAAARAMMSSSEIRAVGHGTMCAPAPVQEIDSNVTGSFSGGFQHRFLLRTLGLAARLALGMAASRTLSNALSSMLYGVTSRNLGT